MANIMVTSSLSRVLRWLHLAALFTLAAIVSALLAAVGIIASWPNERNEEAVSIVTERGGRSQWRRSQWGGVQRRDAVDGGDGALPLFRDVRDVSDQRPLTSSPTREEPPLFRPPYDWGVTFARIGVVSCNRHTKDQSFWAATIPCTLDLTRPLGSTTAGRPLTASELRRCHRMIMDATAAAAGAGTHDDDDDALSTAVRGVAAVPSTPMPTRLPPFRPRRIATGFVWLGDIVYVDMVIPFMSLSQPVHKARAMFQELKQHDLYRRFLGMFDDPRERNNKHGGLLSLPTRRSSWSSSVAEHKEADATTATDLPSPRFSTRRVIGVWDDHDMGANDGGKEFALRKEMQHVLLEFLGVAPLLPNVGTAAAAGNEGTAAFQRSHPEATYDASRRRQDGVYSATRWPFDAAVDVFDGVGPSTPAGDFTPGPGRLVEGARTQPSRAAHSTTAIAHLSTAAAAASSSRVASCDSELHTCNWYRCVEETGILSCGTTGYALSYGFHFCTRFDATLQSWLAEQGGALQRSQLVFAGFVNRTGQCLRHAADRFLRGERTQQIGDASFPAPQSTTMCDDFLSFSFESHPTCYVESGVCALIAYPTMFLTLLEILNDRATFQQFGRTIAQVVQTAYQCGRVDVAEALAFCLFDERDAEGPSPSGPEDDNEGDKRKSMTRGANSLTTPKGSALSDPAAGHFPKMTLQLLHRRGAAEGGVDDDEGNFPEEPAAQLKPSAKRSDRAQPSMMTMRRGSDEEVIVPLGELPSPSNHSARDVSVRPTADGSSSFLRVSFAGADGEPEGRPGDGGAEDPRDDRAAVTTDVKHRGGDATVGATSATTPPDKTPPAAASLFHFLSSLPTAASRTVNDTQRRHCGPEDCRGDHDDSSSHPPPPFTGDGDAEGRGASTAVAVLRQLRADYEHLMGSFKHAVCVVLLDARYHRDDPFATPVVGAPPADILGEDQWRWLEFEALTEQGLPSGGQENLTNPSGVTVPISKRLCLVTVIGSGIQIISDEKPSESWAFFPHARRRLFSLLRRIRLERFVFASGDVHMGEMHSLVGGYSPLRYHRAAHVAPTSGDEGTTAGTRTRDTAAAAADGRVVAEDAAEPDARRDHADAASDFALPVHELTSSGLTHSIGMFLRRQSFFDWLFFDTPYRTPGTMPFIGKNFGAISLALVTAKSRQRPGDGDVAAQLAAAGNETTLQATATAGRRLGIGYDVVVSLTVHAIDPIVVQGSKDDEARRGFASIERSEEEKDLSSIPVRKSIGTGAVVNRVDVRLSDLQLPAAAVAAADVTGDDDLGVPCLMHPDRAPEWPCDAVAPARVGWWHQLLVVGRRRIVKDVARVVALLLLYATGTLLVTLVRRCCCQRQQREQE